MERIIFIIVATIMAANAQGENCPVYPTPVPLSMDDPLIAQAFSILDGFLAQSQIDLELPSLVCSVVYDQVCLMIEVKLNV